MELDLREIQYCILLSLCKWLSKRDKKSIYEAVGSAVRIFENLDCLTAICPSISTDCVKMLKLHVKDQYAIDRVKREVDFILRYNVLCYTYNSESYPKRLRDCLDAPLILFSRTPFDFNQKRLLTIVGTRNCTEYGLKLMKGFVNDLSVILGGEFVVVSGLARGIESQLHYTAMQNGVKTVGVFPCGLYQPFPSPSSTLPLDISTAGGAVITETLHDEEVTRDSFVPRNRLLACLGDALLVVEANEKSGCAITSNIADSYNKEVYTFPHPLDSTSGSLCNKLLSERKAVHVNSASEFAQNMGWC